MVARLIEGWESSTAVADYAGKWTSLTAASIAGANGRNGNGLRLNNTAHAASRTFDNQATWVVGFAFRLAAYPTSAAIALCQFQDGGTVQCGLAMANTTGQLFAFRSGTATNLGTASFTPLLNTWCYLEVKATISDAAGVFVVRANGATVLNLSAVDTKQTANAFASIVYFGPNVSVTSGINLDYDDLYVLDGSGSVNNDFLGDCKVEAIYPTGAGATTAWTPSAGANWDAVNEAPPTGDTDYVSSATAGQTDTYAYGDLSVATSGTVKAVQATALARKDDAGSRSLALVARPGSTDRVGATQAVADTYAAYAQVWDVNPDTSAAWTVAQVNASSFGQRLIA